MQAGTQPTVERRSASPYTLKTSPYSSHSRVLRLLPERGEGTKVLDLGCGPGYISAALAARGYAVTAVDFFAPEELPAGVESVAADLNLGGPAMEGRFDYVLLADVLEHLLDPTRLLAWAVGRLEPGGHMVICVPNVAHLYVRLKLLMGNFDYAPRGILDRTHLHFYTRKTFLALLRECGLRPLQLYATPVPLELLVPRRWQGAAFRAVDALSAASARLLPRLLAYQFVSLAAPENAS